MSSIYEHYGQVQIGLFLKIDLATGNHVSQYHL